MSFTDDFKSANADFTKFHDELLRHIKGEMIVDIETNDSRLGELFDQYSGIDAIQVVNKQLRTIAVRVQWGKAWNTFTIRYKRSSGAATEYQKRAEAILSGKGFLYPYLTVQAYLDRRDNASTVLSCCVVKTIDLYGFIFENMASIGRRTCPEGNIFIYIPFQELVDASVPMILFGDNQIN